MDSLKSAIETALPFFFALFGGIAGVMHRGVRSWAKAAQDIFVAGFTGFIAYQFMGDFGVWDGPKASIAGISGYAGPVFLDVMYFWVLKKLGVEHKTSRWDGIERRKKPRNDDDNANTQGEN